MSTYGGGAVHRLCDDGPTCTDPKHLEVRPLRCRAAWCDFVTECVSCLTMHEQYQHRIAR